MTVSFRFFIAAYPQERPGEEGRQRILTLGRGPIPPISRGAVRATRVPLLAVLLSKIERGDTWIVFSDSLIEAEASNSEPWRRAFSGNELWDLSLTGPAEPLFYGAPTLFDGTWLNEDKYPEDASLEGDVAVYRSGLESPMAEDVVPVVESFDVVTKPGATTLTWRALVGGEEITRPLDVTYWEKDTPSNTTTVSGKSGLTLELKPQVTYEAELYGSTREFTTRPEPPDITVYGQAVGSGGYEYVYELADNELEEWTDPFGDTHTEDQVTVQSPDAISSHRLVLTWASDEQTVSVETTWRLPNEKVEVEATAETGLLIPASQVPSPAFTQQQFSGTRERILQNDVYGAGTWHISPAGYLPQAMEGTVDEYVDASFILPGGEEAGKTVELPRPTELSIKLTIEAENGLSPIVYGVVRWQH